MSVETKGLINGKVYPVQIVEFLRERYDRNANAKIDETSYDSLRKYGKVFYSTNCVPTIKSGFITFEYNGRARSMFYIYENYNAYENLDYYKEFEEDYPGITKAVTGEYTKIWLGHDEDAINIISEIIANFGGGWIDKNDCDDIPYVPIEAATDYSPVYSINISVDLSANKLRKYLVDILDYLHTEYPDKEKEIAAAAGIPDIEVDVMRDLEKGNDK